MVLVLVAAALAAYGQQSARPAELPVEQPTKFELVINLKTAKASALPSRSPSSSAPTR